MIYEYKCSLLTSAAGTRETFNTKKISLTDHTRQDIWREAVVAWSRRAVADDTGCRRFVRRRHRLVWRLSHTDPDTSSVRDLPPRGIPRTGSYCMHDSNKNSLLRRL